MKKFKQTCLTAVVLSGLAGTRSATAGIFLNVTPTFTGGLTVSGGGLTSVPLQSAGFSGLNQNLSAGTSNTIFATADNTYNSSSNSIAISVTGTEGYNGAYIPDPTTGSNASIGVSFQVAGPGTFELSGYGYEQATSSYELQTLSTNGTFTAMQGSNTVLSVQNYEGFEWLQLGKPTVVSPVLDLTLTPGTIYTLDVTCSDIYANVNGLGYYAANGNPRYVNANLTITNLTASVPEPTGLTLLTISSIALLRRRRVRGA